MFKNFKLIFRLIALDSTTIPLIAKNPSATIDGLLILFLAGMASMIGAKSIFEMEEYRQFAFDFTLNNVIFFAIFFIFSSICYLGFSFLIARSIGGKFKFREYFRNMAFANTINILNLFSGLSLLSNIWIFILNYQILKKLNNFSGFQSFITLLTSILSIFAFIILLLKYA